MIFILITLFIDILGIGIIIPVVPELVKQFVGGSLGGVASLGVLLRLFKRMPHPSAARGIGAGDPPRRRLAPFTPYSRRCSATGIERRTLATLSRSISASARPGPSGAMATIWPQGSTIIAWP